jgi:GAF domain-containing protein
MRRLQLERDRHVEARVQLEIAQTVCSTLDLNELLKRICHRTAQVCGVDRCTILLLDADSGQLWPVMSQFAAAHEDSAQWEDLRSAGSIQPEDAPVFQKTLRDLESVIVDDVAEENLLPPAWAEEFGIQRLLSVPLVSHEQAIGVIALDYTRPEGRFSRAQIDLAVTIGGQVGIGVENARFVEEMQKSLAQTMTLFNASVGINQARDVAGLLETAVAEIANFCHPDRVCVYLAGPDSRVKAGYLEQVVDWQVAEETTATYRPAEHLAMADVPPLDAFPSSRLNVVVNDLPNNTLLSEPTRRALLLKGIYSLAMVPLVSGGTWVGAILLEREGDDAFDEGAIALCRSLADQAALALDNLLQLEFARRSAAHEYVLRDISARLNQAPDVESVLQVAVEELGKALGVREGSARLDSLANEERSGDG